MEDDMNLEDLGELLKEVTEENSVGLISLVS